MKTLRILSFLLAVLMLTGTLCVYAEDEEEIINYYENYETVVAVGESECPINAEFEYTVFEFNPEESGKYTFNAENALIGIASYNGMWVSVELNAETISSNSFEWDCTDANQSILFAIKSEAASVTVTVRVDELVIVEIPRTPYENKVTPESFSFEGDVDSFQYVETFDDVENLAVLGEDGFYHLDSADGAVLYVKLDDSMMNLLDAYGYGQLVAVYYDENGKVEKKIDYNAAFYEYYLCSDNGLYPLTEDIIQIYKDMGRSNSWYGADGWVGGEMEDAWMFACYYEIEWSGMGDINYDDVIDQFDYILVKRHYFETRYLTDEEAPRADINGDGEVNQFDYILIKRHYFGTYRIV